MTRLHQKLFFFLLNCFTAELREMDSQQTSSLEFPSTHNLFYTTNTSLLGTKTSNVWWSQEQQMANSWEPQPQLSLARSALEIFAAFHLKLLRLCGWALIFHLVFAFNYLLWMLGLLRAEKFSFHSTFDSIFGLVLEVPPRAPFSI